MDDRGVEGEGARGRLGGPAVQVDGHRVVAAEEELARELVEVGVGDPVPRHRGRAADLPVEEPSAASR